MFTKMRYKKAFPSKVNDKLSILCSGRKICGNSVWFAWDECTQIKCVGCRKYLLRCCCD